MSVETRPAPRINGGRKKPALFTNLSGRLSSFSGRRLLLVIAAVLAGLWVAVGVFHKLQPKSFAASSAPRIVVTTRDVERGTVFTGGDLRLIPWPFVTAPEGAFQDLGALMGRSARTHIAAESPVLESSLLPAHSGASLAASVPAGYRAIGITVDPRDGMHRWLSAGDHVDVITTVEGPHAAQSQPSSRILLQDVEVLAISDPDQANARSTSGHDTLAVTLGVLPSEAEKLALGMRIGTLQLLLRHPEDTQAVATSGVTSDTLLPEGGAQSPQDVMTYRSVEVIAGPSRTLQRFHTASGLSTSLDTSEPYTGETE